MAMRGFRKGTTMIWDPNMRVTGASFSRERLGSAAAGVLRAAAEPAPACHALTRAFGERGRRSRSSLLSHRRPLLSPPGRGRP